MVADTGGFIDQDYTIQLNANTVYKLINVILSILFGNLEPFSRNFILFPSRTEIL